MEIELTEAQLLQLEDGDVLIFRPQSYVSVDALNRLQAAVEQFAERVFLSTGKRIAVGTIDADLDLMVVRNNA